RADENLSALLAYVREASDTTDVNQERGLREAEFHRGDEAVPARENLRVARVLGEKRQRFVKRRRRDVIELCRNHFTSKSSDERRQDRKPRALILSLVTLHLSLLLIIRQTTSGLTGMSMCRTPKGESASTMALTMAGVAPIVPASPTPLTPIGFTSVGVSVRSSSNHGIIFARGTA